MKILLVDDDVSLTSNVRKSLEECSHAVDVSADGSDGAFLAKSYDYDAIVLDYSLPKKDGLAVCREVRAAGKKEPILFLSNTYDVDVKVSALKAGADDYMTKPFSFDELKARIDAMARRAPSLREPALEIGGVSLDESGGRASYRGKDLGMTRKEFMLLDYFMKNKGVLLSRPQILEHVWTADGNPFSNTVEAHIRNIRKKLAAAGADSLIANLPGRGYVMDDPDKIAGLSAKDR